MGSSSSDGSQPKRHGGRTARSVGKKDYTPVLKYISKMRGMKFYISVIAKSIARNLPVVVQLEPDTIKKMLTGKNPLNPDVLAALSRWSGLSVEELNSDEDWSSKDIKTSNISRVRRTLHDELSNICVSTGERIKIKYFKITTQRVIDRLPAELQLPKNGIHYFVIEHEEFAGSRILLLEYGYQDHCWWSLLDRPGATIREDGSWKVVDGATALRRECTDLQLQIGADSGIFEIFVIASRIDFPESVTKLVFRNITTGRVPDVKEIDLMNELSIWTKSANVTLYGASIAYNAC